MPSRELIPPISPLQIAQVPGEIALPRGPVVGTNPFEDILSKAVDALDGLSAEEIKTNQLIQSYLQGTADPAEVITQSAKFGTLVQLAVTVMTSVVTTFKEITTLQI